MPKFIKYLILIGPFEMILRFHFLETYVEKISILRTAIIRITCTFSVQKISAVEYSEVFDVKFNGGMSLRRASTRLLRF